MSKHKVLNNNKFPVGIKFENKPGHDIVIRPNSFVFMDLEDILYVDSVSKLFEKGFIFTDDKEALETMGYIEQNPNTISKQEVKDILLSGNSKVKHELSKITESHAIQKVIEVLREGEVDPSQSKIKIIEDALGIDVREALNDDLV